MTAEFELVMRLMGAASRGTPTEISVGEVDWQTVYRLAEQQQIQPLICHAVRRQALHRVPNELPAVLAQCARTGLVIALLEEMEAAGIAAYVVKGFAAGRNYAVPEYRICGDTDIVIAPEDEERASAFLEQHGFLIRPRWEHGHHAVASHPQMGVVEVHVRLYDELIEEVWFGGFEEEMLLHEPKQRVETPDGSYWMLGPTDHAIYMALHMVKHFILSGNSLRMMMDLALALAGQRDGIDTQRFWNTMDSLHYGTLIRSVLWAMILYCGFSPEEFSGIGECDTENVRLILEDLEQGGWLGKNKAEEREAGWHEYNRHLLLKKEKSEWRYRLYMLNWGHSFRLSTLFPGKNRLARDYPLIEKYPCLIPFVWLHRIAFRGGRLLLRGAWTKLIAHEQDETGKKRFEMFRRLDMIE